jgi:hypothetical protein
MSSRMTDNVEFTEFGRDSEVRKTMKKTTKLPKATLTMGLNKTVKMNSKFLK